MTILYTEVITNGFNFWKCFGIFGISLVIGFFIFLDESDITFTFMMTIVFTIITTLAIPSIGGFALWSPHTEHNRYTVMIDDTVNFKEFTDKYKVIEQKDDLYIIEEIEN